ncbi:MAG: hypothetical protein M3011_00005, partial [Actinomycetota bacterium]|nr:hypothetical protein [Actinomycetota bacterium]
LVTIPLALAGVLFARPAMQVLFGAQFGQAAGLLRLLLVAAVPSAVVIVVAPLAFLRGRAVAVRGFLVMLVADVGLNLALIPAMGSAGSALATLACQVVLAGWLWRTVLRLPPVTAGVSLTAVAPEMKPGVTAIAN